MQRTYWFKQNLQIPGMVSNRHDRGRKCNKVEINEDTGNQKYLWNNC